MCVEGQQASCDVQNRHVVCILMHMLMYAWYGLGMYCMHVQYVCLLMCM